MTFTRNKLAYYYHIYNYQKTARNIIKNANPPIKKLSDLQIKDVKDYYSKYGYAIRQTYYHRILTSINDEFSVKYIPEDIFHVDILPALNCNRQAVAWGNKAMFDYFFPEETFPKTIVRNMNGIFYDEKYEMITREKAGCIVKDLECFVIKPIVDTGSGIGVKYIDNISRLDELFDNYRCDYLIQLPIEQHGFYKSLNSSSVNSLKIMSLLWNGEVRILSTVIRVGAKGSFTDNVSSGDAYMININQYGHMHAKKFNFTGNVIDDSDFIEDFNNKSVPGYLSAVEVIKRMHMKLPYFRLISWDFAIDINENPILIEYNLRSPDAKMHQIFNDPLFGDLTDEILKHVHEKE